jgi:hypothetical protein
MTAEAATAEAEAEAVEVAEAVAAKDNKRPSRSIGAHGCRGSIGVSAIVPCERRKARVWGGEGGCVRTIHRLSGKWRSRARRSRLIEHS